LTAVLAIGGKQPEDRILVPIFDDSTASYTATMRGVVDFVDQVVEDGSAWPRIVISAQEAEAQEQNDDSVSLHWICFRLTCKIIRMFSINQHRGGHEEQKSHVVTCVRASGRSVCHTQAGANQVSIDTRSLPEQEMHAYTPTYPKLPPTCKSFPIHPSSSRLLEREKVDL
jgi:hypothetical protein